MLLQPEANFKGNLYSFSVPAVRTHWLECVDRASAQANEVLKYP